MRPFQVARIERAPMEITFRSADPADAEAVAALVNAAYRSLGGWTHEVHLLAGPRVTPDDIRRLIEPPGSQIVLAYQEELLASVHLHAEGPPSPREGGGGGGGNEGRECHLGMLAVHPAHQAAGLGRQLLQHSEELARSWGCTAMRLTAIHLRSELIAYYQRRGYHPSGRRQAFPYHDLGVGAAKVAGMELVELVKPLAV